MKTGIKGALVMIGALVFMWGSGAMTGAAFATKHLQRVTIYQIEEQKLLAEQKTEGAKPSGGVPGPKPWTSPAAKN